MSRLNKLKLIKRKQKNVVLEIVKSNTEKLLIMAQKSNNFRNLGKILNRHRLILNL